MIFKSKSLLLFTIFFITNHLSAQQYQKTDKGIKIQSAGTAIEVQFYTPSTVRIIKYQANTAFSKESLSVIKTPQKVPFTVKTEGNSISLKSDKITLNINQQTGAINYLTNLGLPLLQEKPECAHFTPFNDAGNQTFSVSQAFSLDKDEAIYGLGQMQQGRMIQRNFSVNMIQGNTDDYIPFFQSVKGYGLFWDNYSPTKFSDDQQSTSFSSEAGDGADYYFIYGGNADGVITGMRDLTGKAPMLPLWTYGFWQSKERYKSQNELIDVVKKYRELGVPLDGIIQDWQYWGNNYLWNATEFLNPEFYNPKKMVDDVHGLNAHMIISIWNSFGPHTKPYLELEKKGMLLDIKTWPESGSEKWPPNMDYPSGVRVYDAYNPEARDIFWKYLNKGIFSLGMDGWWIDSSEPDHLQQKPSDFDNKTFLGSFRKVRNAFPLMTVGGVSANQRKTSSDKRVFILTRSAFAGQQRYGANTWSGDIQASWQTLKNQISAGLNFSLCGIPNWNSDIGGFFLSNYRRKLDDPEYRELYARWIQFGTFCPMMRSHGADAPREIYQFGKKGDKVYDAIEKFIKLRYSLLPYIYSTSWDVTANNSSFMRALVMDFPTDKRALNINDQYMFGKSLLISPVSVPMYVKEGTTEGEKAMEEDFAVIKSKETYLPQNTVWYDFWTNEKMNGGTYVKKETSLDVIPVYVKAGSIIPIGPEVQYATEKKWDSLQFRVYPGADGSFVLYEDEFDNYNYEKGAYTEIPVGWDDRSATLTIGARKGKYIGMISNRTFSIILPDGKKKTVSYSGKKVAVKFK
ncbi:glycoside hydrolase family 31 protein [Arcticibacter tournemirensis]